MAKATRTKKVKTDTPTVTEEKIEEVTQPQINEEVSEEVVPVTIEPEETPAAEVELEPAPPIMVIESSVEKEKLYEYAKAAPPVTMEEKLVDFLNGKNDGFIKINDFLKSLYKVPGYNEPPEWLSQGANKQLKLLLTTMQASGKLTVRDNSHLRLGTVYYPDATTMKSHYHNLNTVVIEVATNVEK